MALQAIDKIIEIQDKRILAEKTIHSDEELFQDHFTGFEVYPGVLMLEGLVQSAAWLVRKKAEFKKTVVRLVRCSQVKFSRIVRPGSRLLFESELLSTEGDEHGFLGRVRDGDEIVASARFRLKCFSPREVNPLFGHLEGPLREKSRRLFTGLLA